MTDSEKKWERGLLKRRNFLKAAAATAAGSAQISFGEARAAGTAVRIQYDWLIGNGQLGCIVAQKKGFFQEARRDIEENRYLPNYTVVNAPALLMKRYVNAL